MPAEERILDPVRMGELEQHLIGAVIIAEDIAGHLGARYGQQIAHDTMGYLPHLIRSARAGVGDLCAALSEE